MDQDDDAMKLSDFVSESIKQLLEGVTDAQSAARDHGATVNPLHPSRAPGGPYYRVTKVRFDVSLTTTEGSEKGARIGVFAGAFKAGGRAQASDAASSAGRIRFSVDVVLPVDREAKVK